MAPMRKLATVVRATLRLGSLKRFRRKEASSNGVPEDQPNVPIMGGLPVEILEQIFLAVVHAAYGSGQEAVNEWDPLEVLPAVCHQWRNTMFGLPTLWTRITDATLANAQTHVSRSRDLPLTVTYTTSARKEGGGKSMEPVGVVLGQLHRIRSIQLEADQSTIAQLAQALQSRTAPMLENLDINLYHPAGVFASMDATSLMPIASSLRSLRLENTSAIQALKMLNPGLQELRLICHRIDMRPLALEDVLKTISQLPQLKHLVFRGALDSTSEVLPPDVGGDEPPPMPSPQTLELGESLFNSTVLLHHVDLSALEVLHIHVGQYSSENDMSITRLIFSLLPWLRQMHIGHGGSTATITAEQSQVTFEVTMCDRSQGKELVKAKAKTLDTSRTFRLTFHDSPQSPTGRMVQSGAFSLMIATVAPIELRISSIDYRGPDCLSILAQCPSAQTLLFDRSVIVFEGLERLSSDLRMRILRNVDDLVLQSAIFSDRVVKDIKECFGSVPHQLRELRIRDATGLTPVLRESLSSIANSVVEDSQKVVG